MNKKSSYLMKRVQRAMSQKII